ncbi:MAG: molecular chaperone DnaJ [Ardenticatenales bacterium]|nr:molecular chaperone DnaJ [Ardenticatenales bacterium]
MMAKRDFYEVLGVARGSDGAEIKTSYRRLARQYHPDINKSHDAEERFKEINEAYEILSNEQKRAAYDRFGHAGVQGSAAGAGGFGGFGGFGDIFEEFFGSMSGARRGRPRGPARGDDLRVDLSVSFDEAVFGTEKEIEVPRTETCQNCRGSGAEPGTSPVVCKQCRGTGEVRRVQQSFLGSFVNIGTCAGCGGSGETISTRCSVCQGQKRVQTTRKLKVKIPAGVDNDTRIRLTGEGDAGARGGPPGNLYVFVRVEDHRFFKRRGQDIILDLVINVAQAALGDDVTIPTINGEEKLRIAPGTQPGHIARLRGRGVPYLRRGGRGDQIVIIQVGVPEKLTAEQKQAFQQLSQTLGKETILETKGKGLFDHLKDLREALGL